MRRVVAGLVGGSLMLAVLPASAQSPAPSDLCLPVIVPMFAPALVGLSEADARAIAEPAGLTVTTTPREDRRAEPGAVIEQEPGPGAPLTTTEVALVVAVTPAATPTPRPTRTPVPLTELPFSRLKARAKTPPYRTFFRNAETFVGDLVHFRGKVLQVVPGDGNSADVLLEVTRGRFGLWDDTVWVYYQGRRLLADDIIEVVGYGAAPVTYESAGAGTITVPALSAIQVRRR